MSRPLLLALALVTAAAGGVAALDARAEDRPAVRVNVSRYDLAKPDDAAQAYGQLAEATRRICTAAGHEKIASLEAERFDRCYRDTLDEAIAQANAHQLYWLHDKAVARSDGR
jgi:UrcA family protein